MNHAGDDRLLPPKCGLAGFALFVGLPAQVWFSWLREVPVFWMNEGGYPVWLRDLVLGIFYPLMALNVLLLLGYGALLLFSPPRDRRTLGIQFSVLVLMTCAIFFDAVWALLEHT